ncbi:tetratricopeptide repeat-containing sensor histidine kinase [Labilibaculum antarcticum]|uniref:tetratricopeptide repeat-containing sensor histidine kinase n=1 Tax=Labilibaculum antarcticum TaxID=1717717 RepID=UPI0013C2A8C5|nr:tetratricopeptide repeat protein [Labilibaculum antarcticum]
MLFVNTLHAKSSLSELRTQINNSSKSEKAKLYLKLSDHYYYANNNDSALYYAKEALLVSKLNKNDQLMLESYIELYYNYLLTSNSKEVRHSLYNAKKLAYKISDTTQICDILLNLGAFYSENSKFDSAIIHYNESRRLSDLIDYKTNTIQTLIGIGEVYYERGDFENALNNYLEASKYSEAIKDNDIKLSLLIDMGNIYGDDNQIEKAKSYYNQAKELSETINDKETLSTIYNNLATLYQEEKNYTKAQIYFEKSLEIEQSKGYKDGIAITLNNIGENYFLLKDYENAIIFLRESLTTHRHLKLETEIIYNLEVLTQIHLATGNYKQAIKCLNEGITLSKKLKIKGKRSDLLKLLAEYYNKIGNNKKAYSSMLAFNALKDSVRNDAKSTKIAQLQAKFEAVKKEKENEILRVKNQITQDKLEQEKTKSNFLYIFSILALFVIILIVTLFRSKINTHNKMKRVYGLLEDSNSKLKIMNTTKDKFFSIIAHDLRSPFNAILGFSELIKNEVKSGKDLKTIEDYNANINESAKSLFTLLENLLQWANDQRGVLEFTPIQIDLYELIQSNLTIFKLKATDKSIKLFSDIKPNTVAFGDVNMVNTIIRNLISNALKFTNENGEIFLSTISDGNFIYLSVKDTGIGISKNDQDKLFRLDGNFTTMGTKDESGSGLGLILCKEFVKKNGGKIWVESEENKGSKFIFSLKSA